MNFPWNRTGRQINRMTLTEARCLLRKKPPAATPKETFRSYDAMKAAWQERQAAKMADPWGVGG